MSDTDTSADTDSDTDTDTGTTPAASASASPPPPGFVSYVESILAELARDPGRTVVTKANGEHVTAGEFRDETYRLAAELAARGVGRDFTVAMLVGNRPEALSARYAANLLGARVDYLYVGMAPEVLARVAESVDTELLLVDPELAEGPRELVSRLPGVPVASFGPSGLGDDLLACAARRPADPVPNAAHPEDDWAIRQTGGTTGVPKGVCMAQGPYAEHLKYPIPGAGHPSRFLAATSLAHLSGVLADITLAGGGSVVLQRSFDAGQVLAAIERERITHIWLLPPLLYELLDHPDLATTDLSSLGRVTYGGSPASPSRLRQAQEALGPVLYGAYGQSEAGWISAVGPDEHELTGHGGQVTVGRPMGGVRIEIRDEAGNALAADRIGEIHVATQMIMSGYWKQPELTAQTLHDGWVRTGDVGYLDAAGYLYIVDRIKDMIIVVGGHVYPGELEDLLLTHPAVAQVAVFGVRGADDVEQVHAAIVPAPGHSVDRDLIREYVTEHKGPMYAPAAVHSLPRIPLTSVGKPDKKLLRTTLGE
ncbi:AMP-binding protein [Streptomyces sp. NPDC050610]|uniref:AMP-binding protein n=1 Tax=Streptomyces sp. NPDC050610 TaxID=3157097 RepID=UPI00342FD09B